MIGRTFVKSIGLLAFATSASVFAGKPVPAPAPVAQTFSGSDYAVTEFPSLTSTAYAMAIQSNGKILLGGGINTTNQMDFAIARYNADFTPDTSFNGTGYRLTDLNPNDRAYAMVLQPDGKAVLAGYSSKVKGNNSNDNFALVRYTTSGLVDTTFGTSGNVQTDVSGQSDIAYAMTLDATNRFVVVGRSTVSGVAQMAVVRYLTNGQLDTSFNSTGKLIKNATGNDSLTSVVVQADGKILAGGNCNGALAGRYCLIRLNANGSVDSSFVGGNGTTSPTTGVVVIPPSAIGNGVGYKLSAIKIDSTGGILVAGSADNNTGAGIGEAYIARLSSTGAIDTSWGASGGFTQLAYASLGGSSTMSALDLQSDGRIVFSGWYGGVSSGNQMAVGRLYADGLPDTAFSTNGAVDLIMLPGSVDNNTARAVQITADGIFLGGTSDATDGSGSNFAVKRY